MMLERKKRPLKIRWTPIKKRTIRCQVCNKPSLWGGRKVAGWMVEHHHWSSSCVARVPHCADRCCIKSPVPTAAQEEAKRIEGEVLKFIGDRS
jgi:hypothetical protein